jgi:hypothetical protein
MGFFYTFVFQSKASKMTSKELYQYVLATDVHVKSRVDTLNLIGTEDEVLKFLMKYSFEVKDPVYVNACILLQDVLDKDITRIKPYLQNYLDRVGEATNESSKRLLSRICWLVAKSKKLTLTTGQERQLVDVSMLWLSNDSKVATEAFAMDILMLLAKKYKEDVQLIAEVIEVNYASKSAAYQNKAKKFMCFCANL